MRIQLEFSKNTYAILTRLSSWPYARFWHRACRCRWPLRAKFMLRPFMLTVRIGRSPKPASTFSDMLRWLNDTSIRERGYGCVDRTLGKEAGGIIARDRVEESR